MARFVTIRRHWGRHRPRDEISTHALDQINRPDDIHAAAMRGLRVTHGMSQSKLADQLGVTFQQVQKYENGRNRISASRLQHVAQILRVDVTYFFDETARRSSASKKNGGTTPDHVAITEFVRSEEGKVLVKAFTKIGGATLRRSIVRMVESIADRS